MNKIILGVLLLASAASACATPQRIEYAAQRYEVEARQAAAVGDYSRAAAAHRAAAKQRYKAQVRASGYPF